MWACRDRPDKHSTLKPLTNDVSGGTSGRRTKTAGGAKILTVNGRRRTVRLCREHRDFARTSLGGGGLYDSGRVYNTPPERA